MVQTVISAPVSTQMSAVPSRSVFTMRSRAGTVALPRGFVIPWSPEVSLDAPEQGSYVAFITSYSQIPIGSSSGTSEGTSAAVVLSLVSTSASAVSSCASSGTSELGKSLSGSTLASEDFPA